MKSFLLGYNFVLLVKIALVMSIRLPLIVILGATGSGKTKLSLELATKFGAEIIGADSMQLYKGLDIITAKATKEEQQTAPHHMIDILHPHETCTVVDYRNKALEIIENLLSKNKLPIVVGGTNYYIESLLWKILVDEPGSARVTQTETNLNEHELPSEELHKRLEMLDPAMAKRLHPNNKRKILRSLEVLQQKGRRLSDILKEQQTGQGGSSSGGGLRFTNTLIFWLQCDQNILDDRLNKRVDTMIQQGLLKELKTFHKLYNEERLKLSEVADYTKGVFQSIGFKEFHNYLLLDPAKHDTEEGEKLLQKGLEELKMVTRRYARKQSRWITNRFLSRIDRQVPPLYGLNTNDVEKWDVNVKQPALEIIEGFVKGTTISNHQPLPRVDLQSSPNSRDETFHCETCKRVFVGEFQWNCHKKSNKHKRMVQKQFKMEKKIT